MDTIARFFERVFVEGDRLCFPFERVNSWSQQASVVGSAGVKGAGRVVSEDSVLGYQYSGKSLAVLEKKRIVAHAKPYENIEIGLLLVQNDCLDNGAAHGLKLTGPHLLMVLEADEFLWSTSGLTDDGDDFKALGRQDLCCIRLQSG